MPSRARIGWPLTRFARVLRAKPPLIASNASFLVEPSPPPSGRGYLSAGRVPAAKPARAIHRDRSPLLPLARLCRTIARQRTPCCQPFCLLFSCAQLMSGDLALEIFFFLSEELFLVPAMIIGSMW